MLVHRTELYRRGVLERVKYLQLLQAFAAHLGVKCIFRTTPLWQIEHCSANYKYRCTYVPRNCFDIYFYVKHLMETAGNLKEFYDSVSMVLQPRVFQLK